MSVGRNDPCHCGSGKKYKICCMGKPGDKAAPGAPRESGMSNLQILGIGALATVLICAGLWIAGFARIAQVIGAVMILILVLATAFRRPPPRRETPGDAAGINFGK